MPLRGLDHPLDKYAIIEPIQMYTQDHSDSKDVAKNRLSNIGWFHVSQLFCENLFIKFLGFRFSDSSQQYGRFQFKPYCATTC